MCPMGWNEAVRRVGDVSGGGGAGGGAIVIISSSASGIAVNSTGVQSHRLRQYDHSFVPW